MSHKALVNIIEKVKIYGADGKAMLIEAKIDTGARRSSIDLELAEKLGLLHEENIDYYKPFRSALGKQERPIFTVVFEMAGKKIESKVSGADRTKMNFDMIIGRMDLVDFLIQYDPTLEPEKI